MSDTAATSPFAEILAPYADEVPVALREQYLCQADAEYEIVLGGKMDRVWHRPAWLWPVFWLLARADLFFPETGLNVPTVLVITGSRDATGAPVQIWERTFHFPGRRRRYRSTIVYDRASGCVVEKQGPCDVFEEIAEIHFEPPGTLEFLTVRSVMRLGRFTIPLPGWLWVSGNVRQVIDSNDCDASRVTLEIRHRLLGPIFGYEGTFKCSRRVRRVII